MLNCLVLFSLRFSSSYSIVYWLCFVNYTFLTDLGRVEGMLIGIGGAGVND